MAKLKTSEQKLVFAHMWDFISHLVETPDLACRFPDTVRECGIKLMTEANHVAFNDNEILDARSLFNAYDEPENVGVPEVQAHTSSDAATETQPGCNDLEK